MKTKSYDVELDAQNCMKLPMKLLEIGGLWYNRKTKSVVYTLYNKFTIIFVPLFSLCCFIQLYESRNNFEELLEILSINITMIMFLSKIYIFVFKKKEAAYVVETMPLNFFIHENNLTLENKEIIKITLQNGKKIIFLYLSATLSGNAIYLILSPILSPVPETFNSTDIGHVLPVKLWLPFDQMVSPNYEIAYTLITLGSLFIGYNFIVVDVFLLVKMVYLTGQFILLSDALCNMTRNVYKRVSHICNNEEQLNANNSRELTDNINLETAEDGGISIVKMNLIHLEAEKYLIECIKHHQSLIDFTAKFNELWNTFFFVECITASVLLCFLGYKSMRMDVDINLIKMLLYLAAVTFQLLLQCSFGSNLISQSEAVYNAAYSSDWYNQSAKYKEFTQMMIMNAQEPVKLTAGRFGVLSLPLFAAMMQSSYSYIALLIQMQEG